MTTPHIAHLRCTRWKCATLSQRPLRHAQRLPLAPSTNGMTRPTKGTNTNSAMKVLFPIPQIQLSRNAPQFQRSTSVGIACGSVSMGWLSILCPAGEDASSIRTISQPEQLFAFECNRMNMPAVIRLLAMHRATIAEEAFVGIVIDSNVVFNQHRGIFDLHPDEAREVEHRMLFARGGNKEPAVFRVGIDEAFDEFVADFVRRLPDQGADRSNNAAALGAEFFHRLDGGF